jgi:hypothetical protein
MHARTALDAIGFGRARWAVLTQRAFVINYTRPVPLHAFLEGR